MPKPALWWKCVVVQGRCGFCFLGLRAMLTVSSRAIIKEHIHDNRDTSQRVRHRPRQHLPPQPEHQASLTPLCKDARMRGAAYIKASARPMHLLNVEAWALSCSEYCRSTRLRVTLLSSITGGKMLAHRQTSLGLLGYFFIGTATVLVPSVMPFITAELAATIQTLASIGL